MKILQNRWLYLVFSLILLMSLVLSACAKPESEPAPAPPEATVERTLKLGLMVSTTGPIAAITEPIAQAQILGAKWINDEGGLKYVNPQTGKEEILKLDVLWEDTGYLAPSGIATYKRFREAECVLITQMSSLQAEATVPLSAQDKQPEYIAQYSPTALQILPRYTVAGTGPYQIQMGGWMKWLAEREPGAKIGCIAGEAGWGRQHGEQPLFDYAKSLGLEYIGFEVVPMAPTDVSIELKRLQDKGADWIYVALTSGGAALILKDADRIGIHKDIKWMGCNFAHPEEMIKLAGDLTKGMHGLAPTPTAAMTDVEAVQVMSQYIKKEIDRDYTEAMGAGFMQSVSAAHMLKTALEKFGYPLTPEQVVYGMMNLNLDWHGFGAAGPLRTSPDFPFSMQDFRIYQISGDLQAEFTDSVRVTTDVFQGIVTYPVPEKQVWEE
jgi:ABC-type branched-subunit amino acid transport system substrate-binding protein